MIPHAQLYLMKWKQCWSKIWKCITDSSVQIWGQNRNSVRNQVAQKRWLAHFCSYGTNRLITKFRPKMTFTAHNVQYWWQYLLFFQQKIIMHMMKLSMSNKRTKIVQKSLYLAFLFPPCSFTCYFSINLTSPTLQRRVNCLFFFDSIYTFPCMASKLCIFCICFYLSDHLPQWKLNCSSIPQSFGVFFLSRWQRTYYVFSLLRYTRWTLYIVLLNLFVFLLFLQKRKRDFLLQSSNFSKKH